MGKTKLNTTLIACARSGLSLINVGGSSSLRYANSSLNLPIQKLISKGKIAQKHTLKSAGGH